MSISAATRENPFRDPQSPPQWAQLTRLGGDRAAILFEDLRRQVSAMEGLSEELFYFGPERGWAPHYKAGDQVLFSADIRPGMLEVEVEIGAACRDSFLVSRSINSRMKEALRAARVREGVAVLRLRLANAPDVRSFAKLVVMKSKFEETRPEPCAVPNARLDPKINPARGAR